MDKRVLLLTLRSDEGGGPRLVTALADGLRQDGWRVFVASPLDNPYGSKLQQISLESGGAHFQLTHRTFRFSTALRLRKFCRANRIELVHSHGLGGGLFSRLMPGRVIHQPHGTHKPESLLGQFKIYLDKLLLLRTDTVIYISESEMRQAHDLGLFRKGRVIENPLIGHPIRSKMTESKTRTLIGNLARLDPIKRHDGLISLFRVLREKRADLSLSLTIMGDGEEREKIARLLGPNEQLLPFSPDPFGFIASLDVFVSASRSEGFGLTVLEAMACGVPCLVSTAPGHDDFIERGWVRGFDFSDAASFVEGFNEILSGEFRPPLPEKIAALYSPEVWIRKFVELYENGN